MKFQFLILVTFFSTLLMMSACSDADPGTQVEEEMEQEMEEESENNGSAENLGVAPDFAIKTWEGDELKLETYKNKVLVIFFFGNTCPPCIGVGPDVEEKLNKDLRGKDGYAIIGIDQWDGNDASVEGFKKNTGVEFPLGVMGSGVAKDYGTTYDRLVVVGKDGNINYRGSSVVSNNLDEVVTLVKGLVD